MRSHMAISGPKEFLYYIDEKNSADSIFKTLCLTYLKYHNYVDTQTYILLYIILHNVSNIIRPSRRIRNQIYIIT